MELISDDKAFPEFPGQVCAAIGFFDGVHLGHRGIIDSVRKKAAQHQAISMVITFDRHPLSLIAPGQCPPLIYPLQERRKIIAALGIDYLWELRFDESLRQCPGDQFVRDLNQRLDRLVSLHVGRRFTFGSHRSGDVTLMKRLGKELGFEVFGLDAIRHNNQPVSSTRIRELIGEGHLKEASNLLGAPWRLVGKVSQGDKLGQQLGFPTANMSVDGIQLPPHGVYAVNVAIESEAHPGAMNIGMRPTLNDPSPSLQVEVHLLGYQGDLYGRELGISFVQKIREERRFANLDELKSQIARDVVEAAEITGTA